MATSRFSFGLCKPPDGALYATGGVNFEVATLATMERYDPDLDIWSAAPSLPRSRYAHCAFAMGDSMYVLGGIEQDEEGTEVTVKSVLKFDCRMQTWSKVAPMPEELDSAGACVIGGDIYVFGGNDEEGETTSTTYRFSTESNEWVTLAPMPDTLNEHSVCVLDGLIYVMGGLDRDNNFGNGFDRFDPVANL
jgi:N-acetylneuraminic acid mutarotase